MNITITLITVYFEAQSLNENFITHMMTKLTASNNWFPFIHEFQTQTLDRNVSFSDNKIQLPFSNSTGTV